MKRTILLAAFATLSSAAAAQSSVTLSGIIQQALTRGNGGSTPLDGLGADRWALNDQSSLIDFSGREDLGGGLYAGFQLSSFVLADSGEALAPFWSNRSIVKLGGAWGELYAGRSLTPAALTAIDADPWAWDGSAAQLGWQIQWANYTSSSYLRTDNTVAYVSPKVGGLVLHLAAAAGEGQTGRGLGASLNYRQGPLWLALAYERSKGFDDVGPDDRVLLLAGAYDFGAVRPGFSVTRSKVDGRDHKAYTVSATAPITERVTLRAGYGHLDDWNLATSEDESLRRLSVGGQYGLSKRSTLFLSLSQSKGETASSTNTTELGIAHSF